MFLIAFKIMQHHLGKYHESVFSKNRSKRMSDSVIWRYALN